MSWVAVVAGGTALYSGISANQARQKQKGEIGKQVAQGESHSADLQPYRVYAQNEAADSQAPKDFSADYFDPTNPFAGGGYTAITPKYAPLIDKTVGTVANAPDRMALTKGALDDYDANEAIHLRDQYRDIGQQNAKLGRIGSGMVNDESARALGDATVRRRTLANDLTREAVSGTLDDRLKQLSAIRGVSNDDVNLQGSERSYLDTKGRDAVGYKTAQRAAESGAKDAAARRAGQYAGIGYGGGADYSKMAGFYGGQADANDEGVNSLLQYLPYLLNKGKKPASGRATGATGGFLDD